MPIGTTRGGGVRTSGIPQSLVGSSLSTVVIANDDARTAQSATDRYNPAAIDDSTFHWVRVPAGTTRVLCRAKCAIATTAVGTSPVVILVGALDTTSGSKTDCANVTDGTVQFLRLDAATWAASGQTLTFNATPTTSNSYNDAAYFYSDVISLTATDLQGCEWVGVPVITASATTASTAVIVELIFQS